MRCASDSRCACRFKFMQQRASILAAPSLQQARPAPITRLSKPHLARNRPRHHHHNKSRSFRRGRLKREPSEIHQVVTLNRSRHNKNSPTTSSCSLLNLLKQHFLKSLSQRPHHNDSDDPSSRTSSRARDRSHHSQLYDQSFVLHPRAFSTRSTTFQDPLRSLCRVSCLQPRRVLQTRQGREIHTHF